MKTFFAEVRKTVSDFKFYKEVKNFSIGRAFKYMLLLGLFVSFILSVRYGFALHKGLGGATDWMKNNLPLIEIENGAAKVEAEQPFKVTEGDFAVVLDTTGKTTSLDEYKTGVLLMKDKLIYKENPGKTEIYALSDIKSLRIDENFMNAFRRNAVWIIFPFMFLGIFIYMIIARILQVVVFSLVTIFAAAVNKVKLTYSQIFTMGVFAITPSTLLGASAALFLRRIPGTGIAFAAVYIAYLIMAVLNCKEER